MESPDKLIFGSYEVLQNPDGSPCILGEGGFGVTYKARHTLLGRTSALKVIREDLLNRGIKEDHEETKRFLREARAVGRLNHLGIASVFDCALDNGIFYYAMEFCDGGTLKDWCRENGPMPWHELRVIAYQIASALDCAHENGLIHRDIKPSNIMLAGEGKLRCAKLIDFGLAQDLSADADCSVSASGWKHVNFGGNLATASPEQILGRKINPQSDLFSLGVTLWWLLLGRSPFRGITRGMIVSDRISTTSYALSLPKDLDPEARVLLESLLEKDVEKRLPSARAVMALLNANQSPYSPSIPIVAHEPLLQPSDFEQTYRLQGVLSSANEAKLYNGIDIIKGSPMIAILPDQSMDPRALAGMRIASQRGLDIGAYAFLDWRFSEGGDVFVLSKPDGCNLLAILRKLGPASLEEAFPLLSHLARSFDASIAWTTFGIRLDPAEILVKTPKRDSNIESFQTWTDIDPASIGCLPQFSPELALPSTSVTTLFSLADFPPLAQFAALVHRVLVGSAVRYAAFFTTDGYVKSRRLSEGGNALLAEMLCNPEADPSATDFLMMLADAECVILGEYPSIIDFPTNSEIERGKLPPRSSELNPVSDGTRGPAREELKPQSPAHLDTQPHKLTAADMENARIQSDEYEQARMEFERLRVLEVLKRRDEAKARRMAEREARYREIAQRADLDAEKLRLAEEQSRMVAQLELELARKKQESLEIETKLAQTRLEMGGKQPQESTKTPSPPTIPVMPLLPSMAAPQMPTGIVFRLPISSARLKLVALAAVLVAIATAAVMMIPGKDDSSIRAPSPAVIRQETEKPRLAKIKQTREDDAKILAEKERLAKLEAEKAEKERQAMLDAEKAEMERLVKLEAGKAEEERLAKLEADKLEKDRQAKLDAEKSKLYPVTIKRSVTTQPDRYRYSSFRVEEDGVEGEKKNETYQGASFDAKPGSQWKITLLDDKKADLATVTILVPDGQKGRPLAVELPASLPVLRVENPYKNADYTHVKLTLEETAAAKLSASLDKPLKIGAGDFSLKSIPKEQTIDFPSKEKPLVMPFAGKGQWSIIYTGSRLKDKTEKPPVANGEPMADTVLKTPPPFSGHYSIIARMTPFPVKENPDLKPLDAGVKPAEGDKLPEIDYFNDLYLSTNPVVREWLKKQFKKIINSYGLPYYYASVMDLNLQKNDDSHAGRIFLVIFLPEVCFVQYGGSLDIHENSGPESLGLVMTGNEDAVIEANNADIQKWIRTYVLKAGTGDTQALDGFLRESLSAWISYQGQKLWSGKATDKNNSDLNFEKWTKGGSTTEFRFELNNSNDGGLIMKKALHVIGPNESLANNHNREKDAPEKFGAVLLREDSGDPDRKMQQLSP